MAVTYRFKSEAKRAGALNWPQQKKQRPLTVKEHAVVDLHLQGKSNTDIGMQVYNVSSRVNAANTISQVLKRPEVQNEIERRIAARGIVLDKHLDNINELAMTSEKDDVRLRASQDLLDRAGVDFKYYADDGKVQVEAELTEEEFSRILERHRTRNEEESKLLTK